MKMIDYTKGYHFAVVAMTHEEWRPIRGYERSYEISSNGKVRSLPRRIEDSHGRVRTRKGLILKPSVDSNGYKTVSLNHMGKQKSFKLHRLVAEAFVACAGSGMQINHMNFNKLDNRASNLEWVTASENKRHGWISKRLIESGSLDVCTLSLNEEGARYLAISPLPMSLLR